VRKTRLGYSWFTNIGSVTIFNAEVLSNTADNMGMSDPTAVYFADQSGNAEAMPSAIFNGGLNCYVQFLRND